MCMGRGGKKKSWQAASCRDRAVFPRNSPTILLAPSWAMGCKAPEIINNFPFILLFCLRMQVIERDSPKQIPEVLQGSFNP